MDKRIKVLQFTVAASKGGQTQYVLNTWKHIDKTRFQFDFVTFNSELDFEEELKADGCKVFHMSCYPEKNREQFLKGFNTVLDRGYDVIEIHTSFWKDTIVEECAVQKGIKKIIIHSHSSGCARAIGKKQEEEAMALHNHVKGKITADIATDFWACSKKAAEWLYGDRIEKDKIKIKIIPNAIDTRRFSYQPALRNKVRHELGIEHKYVLGHVGRLEYVKNHMFLLEVFADILRVKPDVVLLLVGEGKMREAIEEKGRDLGITDNLIMIGKSDVPEKYLQAMDAFVFPSLFEGFPLSVMEAQSTGLKCLCSDSITNEVAVTDNVEFLPLNDREAWVERILYLSEGYIREDRSELVKAKGYDLYEQIKQLEEEYARSVD